MDELIEAWGMFGLLRKAEKSRDRRDFLNSEIRCSVRLGKFW